MSPTNDERLAVLFEQALELPLPDREAFLDRACADDASLRAELGSLLEASEGADAYFDDLEERVVAPTLSAVADSDSLERLREQLASSYTIERELGRGGMGRVYVAEDVRLKRQVVIKIPPPYAVPPADVESFKSEIELAAQLQHPHIVPVLSADAVGGRWYYTMPFVPGESLRELLAREGTLPVDDALRIWHDVLDALAYAHATGVVHRDIKPANILLSGRNALVADFGIARAIETASGTADPAPGPPVGTPAYMAPEQVGGGDAADPRVDIYQAGLLIYEMLSGRLPFVGASTQERLEARLTRDPLPLTASEAPPRLAGLVMRCLAREPNERPSSADELLLELEALSGSLRHRRSPWIPIGAVAVAVAALAAVFAIGRAQERSAPPRYVPDIAAYEWFQRGTDPGLARGASGQREALEYFQRAIEIDSMYPAAWAGMSRVALQLWSGAPQEERPEWMDLAERGALRAVTVGPSDPDAQAAQGWVRLALNDYSGAERALTRALALDPSATRGHEGLARAYMMTGRPQAELVEARLGVDVDPGSYSALRELALALAMNGRCEDALDGLEGMKRLTPPAGVAGVIAGMCYDSRQEWDEAIAEFRWASGLGAAFGPALLAHSLARAGRRDEARAILSELLAGASESHGAFGVATVYAGLGDYDQAFSWLERAVEEGSVNNYIVHPIFADLHRDTRFRRVEREMGIRIAAP
jgi:tetratricopeptide (TPR) repeat protein